MADLDGKSALVTGGSHGIGLAIAVALARAGSRVAINYLPGYDDRRGVRLSEALHQIRRYDPDAVALPGDVADEEDVASMFRSAQETFGGVDILVNNAGFVTLSTVEEMTLEQWDRMIAVHLRGTFLVTRAALPHMLAQQHGRIINIASQIAQIGKPQYTHYAAAKAGIIGFTRALARETAGRGVLVNCIAPGAVSTGIVPSSADAPPPTYGHLPIGRVGQPEEIAPSAVFLAGNSSTFYTGQTLGPNGGEVMF